MGNSSSRNRNRDRQTNNVTYQQYPAPYPAPAVYNQRLPLPSGPTQPQYNGVYEAQYMTNGQVWTGGWRTNYPNYPNAPPPAPSTYHPRLPPGRGAPPQQSQEFTQTATIRNSVNLKKETLRLTPCEHDEKKLQISFTFDASSPCNVTTFVLGHEEANRSKISTPAPPPPGVTFEKGLGLKFPKAGDPTSKLHIIDLNIHSAEQLSKVENDVYPLLLRLETLTEEGVKDGRSLAELQPGDEQRNWVQSQTTYATVVKNDEGEYECRILEQKIWVKGVSYKLQEIYGMDSSAKADQTPEDAEERLCVICLCNERDTTVLPCRHMCMCKECAQELSKQTSKCPICRNTVDSLLHIKVQKKSKKSSSGKHKE